LVASASQADAMSVGVIDLYLVVGNPRWDLVMTCA
jgi:hypothetical protein